MTRSQLSPELLGRIVVSDFLNADGSARGRIGKNIPRLPRAVRGVIAIEGVVDGPSDAGEVIGPAHGGTAVVRERRDVHHVSLISRQGNQVNMVDGPAF